MESMIAGISRLRLSPAVYCREMLIGSVIILNPRGSCARMDATCPSRHVAQDFFGNLNPDRVMMMLFFPPMIWPVKKRVIGSASGSIPRLSLRALRI